MTITSEENVYGRMRQRVVAVGGVRRRGKFLVRSGGRLARDKSLRALLQSGAVTHGQLESAVRGFAQAPSGFLWLADIDEAVLETADRVFLAKHGRPPTQNGDFHLNGDYHKICRSLQHNLHHYDSQLEEASESSPSDVLEVAKERTDIHREKSKRKGLWAFIAVLVLGLCSAPLVGAVIVTVFPERTLMAGLLLGGSWLVVLFVALILTLPKRVD